MSDFTPINSQEEFDKAISARINREREKYSGWISPDKIKEEYVPLEAVNQIKADYDKQIAERDAQIKGFATAAMKTRVAFEMGLPYGAAEFLRGEDEASIRESAEALKKLQAPAPVAPTFKDSASNESDGVTAAFKRMNPNIKF